MAKRPAPQPKKAIVDFDLPEEPVVNEEPVNIEQTGQELAVVAAGARERGRKPFEWTVEMEETLFSSIIAGKSIRQIVTEEGEGFPSADTIYRRIASDAQFSDKYARAKDFQQDTYAEEIVAIADGYHPAFVGKGIDQIRNAIEQRKWTMGKLKPKKYNDKIMAEITGKDGAALIPTQRIDVNSLSDEARESLKFALLALSNRTNAEDIYEEDEDE